MGYYSDIVYKLENGNVVSVAAGSKTWLVEGDGNHIYSWSWDGKEVSEERYNELLESYLAGGSAQWTNSSYSNLVADVKAASKHWYYLDPSTGAMVTGWTYIGGKYDNFGTNGVCQNP